VLYVVQVRDRLLSFLIAPDGLSWLDCSITGRRLQQLVDQQRNALQRGDEAAVAKASRPITACVLDKHLPRLRGVQRLAIVPAGPLNALSFAALLMPDTKQYLVEHFVLAVAPSASRLLRGTALKMQPPSTALAVINPRPATLDGNSLADLRYAEADAITVEHSYANAVVLARERATRQAFVELAPKAEMVHFAGHAVAHPTNIALSRLILADAVDRSGSLFMGDILKLSFDHTKLVVLAACSTAEGRLLRGAGSVSLATAFLDAGVPNVVASLWAVEDREANALFRTFHSAIARGLTPAVALREAQLSVLKQTVPRYGRPQVWAAFQSLGSISTSSIGE
jgi:CHAT domain-containing protein